MIKHRGWATIGIEFEIEARDYFEFVNAEPKQTEKSEPGFEVQPKIYLINPK